MPAVVDVCTSMLCRYFSFALARGSWRERDKGEMSKKANMRNMRACAMNVGILGKPFSSCFQLKIYLRGP